LLECGANSPYVVPIAVPDCEIVDGRAKLNEHGQRERSAIPKPKPLASASQDLC
jgi:hypothetical protein